MKNDFEGEYLRYRRRQRIHRYHLIGSAVSGLPRVRPQWWGCSGGVRRGGFVMVDPSVCRLCVRLRGG